MAAVQVGGDFFLHPDTALDTINAALLGHSANSSETGLADAVTKALGRHQCGENAGRAADRPSLAAGKYASPAWTGPVP